MLLIVHHTCDAESLALYMFVSLLLTFSCHTHKFSLVRVPFEMLIPIHLFKVRKAQKKLENFSAPEPHDRLIHASYISSEGNYSPCVSCQRSQWNALLTHSLVFG